MKHVEGGIVLWCEPPPVCYGKRFGKAHHAGKEMFFPGASGLYGGVCVMNVYQSVLDACLFGGNKRFDVFGSFVVEFMEERFEAAESEPCVDLTIGTEKFFFQAILDGNRTNCIVVLDVEDNNVFIAMVGCDGELASLIGEEVAIDLVDGHENKMCVQVVELLRDIFHKVIKEVGHK
jgi:hypothetical protein